MHDTVRGNTFCVPLSKNIVGGYIMKKMLVTILCCISILACSGCQTEQVVTDNGIGTTCGNITMGSGDFAYGNDFIYIAAYTEIYEYDIQSGKTVVLSVNDGSIAGSVYLSQDEIFYCEDFGGIGLYCMSKDGKKTNTVFTVEADTEADTTTADSITKLFPDGEGVYYMNGVEGTLFYRDLNTKIETPLISGVNTYFADETMLYVIAKENDQWQLLQSSKGTIAFSNILLSFEPIAVFAAGEDIYAAQKGTYQITRYANGEETLLPVCSTFFQVVGDQLLYSDSEEYEGGCFPLKSYDLHTGEIQLLCNNVYDFCLLEDRYVCCSCRSEVGQYYMLLDLNENTQTQMYPEVA